MAQPAHDRIEPQALRLLSKRMVWTKLAMSEDTLDRLRRADAGFPKPVRLKLGGLKWLESDIDDYLMCRHPD